MKKITIADMFCGAGGTSAGAVEAVRMLGRLPELTALNHDLTAIETHQRNHPDARHFCANIDEINPRTLYRPGELDFLWASPECTHHSVARGGRPINEQSRATAWCVARWADALMPKHVMAENVPEFTGWGEVDENLRPIPERKGGVFSSWVSVFQALGYRVEWRVLCAADYGDPTTRRRLFVQMVRGDRRIVWPNPTHAKGGAGGLRPWVPARAIIDWSIRGTSIFGRKKPLSPKTLKRIFVGLPKFSLKPFGMTIDHTGGRASGVFSLDTPVTTVTTEARHALVEPFLVELRGTTEKHLKRTARSLDEPVPVVTAGGHHLGLVEPYLVQVAHGNGQDLNGDLRRCRSVDDPLPTVCGSRGEWALCEPCLLPQHGGGALRSVDEPCPTVATSGAISLIEPFLIEYYGTGGASSLDEPVPTVPTRDRFGLVQPVVTVRGKRYLLDILFRMLQPHELAAAQGFRSDYLFSGNKTQQVRQIGNAVPRRLARALFAAALTQNPDVSWLDEPPATSTRVTVAAARDEIDDARRRVTLN